MVAKEKKTDERKKALIFHPKRGITFSSLTRQNIESNMQEKIREESNKETKETEEIIDGQCN